MAEVKIVGTTRTEFGKGASRRARRDGLVPAVIYGHGEKPLHITLPAKELGVALKQSNVLLDITIDGKNELTLPKVIVRDFLKQILEHVDLVLVRRGEKVVVSVPVHTVGEHDRDGILEHVNNTIDVRVDASSIPNFLEVDIQGLASGTSKYAADVVLPAGNSSCRRSSSSTSSNRCCTSSRCGKEGRLTLRLCCYDVVSSGSG
jgi:large subunit ribosomal protein L25